MYSILAYEESDTSSTAHFVKNIDDEQTLVDVVLNLAQIEIKEEVVCYEIQYVCCCSRVTDNERKSTLRRHSQNYNNLIMKQPKKRQVKDYKITEDHKKKEMLETKRANYQALDKTSKQKLLRKRRTHYKEKKTPKILENKTAKRQALDGTSKHGPANKNERSLQATETNVIGRQKSKIPSFR